MYVQCLSGDPEPLAICWRISALGLRSPALYLAEVGVGDTPPLRELAKWSDLGLAPRCSRM